MKIVIIGTGYVGLVSAVAFAHVGHHVWCLDTNKERIRSLKEGQMPYFEPGVAPLLHLECKEERLHFSDSYEEVIPKSQYLLLALPTPATADGHCDLSYLKSAVLEIVKQMKESKVCIIKSTVPPGTSAAIEAFAKEQLKACGKENLAFEMVSNPEFLKEGNALNDCLKPDRILIGLNNMHLKEAMQELYAPFQRSSERFLWTDILSAELAKYACNAMLATRISFMNELSRLCEAVGADIETVRKVMGTDQRIGYHFLYAGLGYGGSCFPKDLQALIQIGKAHHAPQSIVEAVHAANQTQQLHFFNKILNHFKTLAGRRLTLWGLAFKAETDDLRDSPAIWLAEKLLERGAELTVYDPVALNNFLKHPLYLSYQERITPAFRLMESGKAADAIVLCTEWKHFRRVDLEELGHSMKERVFFDGRNQYVPKEMAAKGFTYISIGR